jgi:membrane associated rhomboid family serine protease
MFPLRDSVPTRRFAVVTAAIIAINAAVWLGFELRDMNAAVASLGFYPCAVDGNCRSPESWPLALVTSMFAHAGWFHIGANMLFLWIFGNNVEDAIGRAGYALFYFGAGVAATASQTLVTLALGTPLDARVPSVGASGAIAGVLGAYLVLYPHARVRSLVFIFLFFTLVDVPAIAFLGIWFLLQLWEGGFSLVAPQTGGGVAFFAHIGGFAFGAFTAWVLLHRSPLQTVRAVAPGWR